MRTLLQTQGADGIVPPNDKTKKMKKLIVYLVIAAAALMAAGCGGNSNNRKQAAETAQAATALEVDNLLADAEKLTGKQVTVEGVCTHICRHGGRKIFLMGTDDTQVIRIEAGEKIGSFKPECVNNVVRVTGTLVEDRIDEAYLAEWELRLKDQIARQHGEGEAGCSAEHQARGESVASSTEKRIADFRARIADRKAKEGKEYLSFYHVDGGSYEVLK